jgi:glutathione peroxidase-family protein
VIIGVSGEETGYTEAKKEEVRALYANEPANFILAEGMKVSKVSGENQSPLFEWLTDINKNKFFDRDVTETGQKFFVNRYGHLYAVIGAQVKLSHPIIGKILSERGH